MEVNRKVVLRSAEPRDAADVVAMAQELQAHEERPARTFTAEAFRRDGFGPNAAFTCLLLEVAAQPAGYVLYYPSYDAEAGERGSHIHDIYLRAAYRGHGHGRALMAAVARATEDSGGTFIWWCMVEGNPRAARFYGHLAEPLNDLRVWISLGDNFERLAAD